MSGNLNRIAFEIISKNQYLALSTIDENRNPWSSILAYAFDQEYNFYFVSLPASKHSKHIKNKAQVSFAIYDSTQGFGLGVGLQIEANATEIKKADLAKEINIYFKRIYPYGNLSNSFTDGLKKLIQNKVYSFYKLTPIHIWINDPNADTDRRVEIKLHQ